MNREIKELLHTVCTSESPNDFNKATMASKMESVWNQLVEIESNIEFESILCEGEQNIVKALSKVCQWINQGLGLARDWKSPINKIYEYLILIIYQLAEGPGWEVRKKLVLQGLCKLAIVAISFVEIPGSLNGTRILHTLDRLSRVPSIHFHISGQLKGFDFFSVLFSWINERYAHLC